MVATFLMVARQVLVLFILMAIGAVANRTNLINQTVVKGMTNIVLYFVTPCVIMESFKREMNSSLVRNLFITLAFALAAHLIGILLATLCIHEENRQKEAVLRFATVFSNCGFMSLPIEEAILGADGVFYGAVFIAVFNVVQWTYGLALMSGGEEKITARKLILNPGIIGVLLGILVFVFQIQFPEVIDEPMQFMADLNTPVPMLIIGFYLGNLRLTHFLHYKKQYLSVVLRLIVVPVLVLLLMLPFHVPTTVAVVCAIASSAPTAAATAMFATKYDKDAQLGAQMVSISTLFSLITIPLMVTVTQLLIH